MLYSIPLPVISCSQLSTWLQFPYGFHMPQCLPLPFMVSNLRSKTYCHSCLSSKLGSIQKPVLQAATDRVEHVTLFLPSWRRELRIGCFTPTTWERVVQGQADMPQNFLLFWVGLLFLTTFFPKILFLHNLHRLWGSDLELRDQKSHPLSTEPRPKCGFLIECSLGCCSSSAHFQSSHKSHFSQVCIHNNVSVRKQGLELHSLPSFWHHVTLMGTFECLDHPQKLFSSVLALHLLPQL